MYDELIQQARGLCDAAKSAKERGNALDSAAMSWAITNNCVPQLCDALEAMTARAEKAEAENRWIPVSERLPEFNERVLIAYEIRGKRCIAIDEATCSNSGVAVWFGVGYACHVTHWRPLPEPPKGV